MDYENVAPAASGIEPLRPLTVDHPVPPPTVNGHDPLPTTWTRDDPLIDLDLLTTRRSMRIVHIGAAILTIIEILYLAVEWRSLAWFHTLVLPLHLLSVLNAGLSWAALGTDTGKPHWRQLVLITFFNLFSITAALAIVTGNGEPLILTVALTIIGAAGLVPWDGPWQMAMTATGVSTIAIWMRWSPTPDQYHDIHWLAIGTAAFVGYFSALMGERYRKELAHRVEQLDANQRRLRDEVAEREAAVAARELSNQRLRESEAKLRKIFATSADAISINRLSDGRYLDLNEGFLRAGYSRAETLANSSGSLGIWANRNQLREFLRIIKTDGAVANFEIEARAKSGAILPFLVSATVVELGGEDCVVSIARDITTFKQTERDLISAREQMALQVEALRESETRLLAEIAERRLAQERATSSAEILRGIFDTTQVGIAINRASDGRFLRVNEAYAEILGYSREELIQMTLRETGIITNRKKFKRFLVDLERLGSIPETEMDLRSRDGVVHPIRISAVKLEIDDAPCVATIAVDISRRMRIEDELIAAREAALAASEAKSAFLSSMSHEIRTPMNAILGMADLLWESDLNTEQRRYLDTMRNNGNMLLDLINEILDLAKVESGRLHLEQIQLDLRDLTEKLLETLAPRAHTKGLELLGRIAPGTPTRLLGDPLRLRQILFNLIGNAIKFTQTGEIELTLERVDSAPSDRVPEFTADDPTAQEPAGTRVPVWIRFTVRDTGIGISSAQATTIFSSFTQADSSTARKYGGSGLGLTIVKRLIELMGGAIAVESVSGSGSKFTVTLPLEAHSSDDDAIAAVASAHDAAVLAGVRVQLLDDRAGSRSTMREQLTAAGATVVEATDVPETLTKSTSANVNVNPYNVLLVDQRMADLAGNEAIGRFVNDPGCAIILMWSTTALVADPDRVEKLSRDTGIKCHYLVKPIKRADLLGAIMEVTGLRPLELASAAGAHSATSVGAAEQRSSVPSVNLRPLRILLADDSPDNRMLIDAYVKKAPYKIDHAVDGSIAVEKFRANHYDLVLMDIQMPVMDGYTATRTIREWERTQGLVRTPIIALTASALDESVVRSIEAGCDAHLSKPVKRATLFDVIIAVTDAAAGGPGSNGKSTVFANGVNKMKRQQIEIEDDLRDLVPDFLAHKRADIGTLRTAIDQKDYECISQIGHKMKGEGGSFGFDAVTAMGSVLEQAALNKDLTSVNHTLDELAEYLESIDVVYT
jgi:PAS domain S-box-containing protein